MKVSGVFLSYLYNFSLVNIISSFEDVIDFNETELFKLTFKGKGHNLRKNKLKKQFLKEKEKLKN